MPLTTQNPAGDQQNLATTPAISRLIMSIVILKSGVSLLYLQLLTGLAP